MSSLTALQILPQKQGLRKVGRNRKKGLNAPRSSEEAWVLGGQGEAISRSWVISMGLRERRMNGRLREKVEEVTGKFLFEPP